MGGVLRAGVWRARAHDAEPTVAAADLEARQAGIGGVPFFIFDRRVAVSGAHEPDVLLQAMQEALQRRS